MIAAERPDFAIHTAAQPSHDKADSIPYDDFDVNAGGTLNLLVATPDFGSIFPNGRSRMTCAELSSISWTKRYNSRTRSLSPS